MAFEDWRPAASLERIKIRAKVLAQVRGFFAERGVLEVETPLLSGATVTDLHLHTLATEAEIPGLGGPTRLHLQTSPEFAMKRLLAAGSGPIYQLCKAFRDQEAGRLHNPEFTILEWYRPGWDHHRLMDEIENLLTVILGAAPARRRSYGELFSTELGVDPHRDSAETLRRRALKQGLEDVAGLDREGWLSLMMTHHLEPTLGRDAPTFLFDYPADQAALARIRHDDPPVAERFEVYVNGIELANGYHELTDAGEQRRRFEQDLEIRRSRGLPEAPIDHRLIDALDHGMPACAGVALGVDRLVMLAAGASDLKEVIAFPIERA
ncbi:MAG: elongation factor P--(R)-beta-lysine ligase [Acidobacteria bacterium]|nr:elongation factor P--(R)-beta-lysine ligase [Acidobacteriota bacterium]